MYWDKDAVDKDDYGQCNQGMVLSLIHIMPIELHTGRIAGDSLSHLGFVPNKKFGCIFGRKKNDS
jgi:hypothetical protein